MKWILFMLIIFNFTSCRNSNEQSEAKSSAQMQNQCNGAQTLYQQALNDINNYIQQDKFLTKANGSYYNHQSILIEQGKKTDVVALVIHGLYESPYYSTDLTTYFSNESINVLSMRLPGFFDADYTYLDDLTYEEWINAVNDVVQLVKPLGEKLIIVGHSLGGALAVHQALLSIQKGNNDIAGLFLFAPALRPAVGFGESLAMIGSIFTGIAGNSFTGTNPEDWHVSYLSGNAANQVFRLSTHIHQTFGIPDVSFADRTVRLDPYGEGIQSASDKEQIQKIYTDFSIPVYLVMVEDDNYVSSDYLHNFFEALPASTLKRKTLPSSAVVDEVKHINLNRIQFHGVTSNFEQNWWNPLLNDMTTFLDHNIRNPSYNFCAP